MDLSLFKKPSAWVPILIPLAFFTYICTYIALSGGVIVREKDEGVGAHLFQLWLVLEPFMLGYFAITWFPKYPKQAGIVLAVQLIAAFMGCFPVFYFKL